MNWHWPSWGVGSVLFCLITTSILYFWLRKYEGEKLTRLYLLSITIKILASCAFVIVFILADRNGANANVIFFLFCYVIFTTAEVVFLLLKKIS